MNELSKPKGFFCCVCGGYVFRFSGRQSNELLFLEAPGYSSSTNKSIS